MTPQERAVILAAQRVSCTADLPESRSHSEAWFALDAALVAHDRGAPDGWWKPDRPSHALAILFGLMLGIAALQAFGWPGVLGVAFLLFGLELMHDWKLYRRERT